MASRTVSVTIRLIDSNDLIVVQFEESISVFFACSSISDKLRNKPADQQASSFGFFRPGNGNPENGHWLQMEKTIGFYKLKDGEILEYKKRVLSHCVRLLDDTIVTLSLDNSSPVCEVVNFICKSIALNHQEEFSLTVDRDFPVCNNSSSEKMHKKMYTLKRKFYMSPRFRWLIPSAALTEQGINRDVVLTLRKKFFVSIEPLDVSNNAAVDLFYIQNKKSVISGALLCNYEEAVRLAGLQCQVTYGEHDPAKHKHGVLNLIEYLARDYIGLKDAEKSVWAEHATLHNMNQLNAKLCYIRLCHSLPTYGAHFMLVREKAEEKHKLLPRLLGISKNGVIRVDVKTRNVITSWPLAYIKRWASGSEYFVLDFGDYRKKYMVQTDESHLLAELITGYTDITTKQSAEQSAIEELERRMKDTVVDKVLPQDRQTQPSDEILTRSIYTPINHQLALETETCEYTQIETSRKRNILKSTSLQEDIGAAGLLRSSDDILSYSGSYDDEMPVEGFPQLQNGDAFSEMSHSLSRTHFLDNDNLSASASYASFLQNAGLDTYTSPRVSTAEATGLEWGYPSLPPCSHYTTQAAAKAGRISQTSPSSCGSLQMEHTYLGSQRLMEKFMSAQAELQKTKQMLVFAEQRAIMAEQRASLAEQRASLSEQRAMFAEQRQHIQRPWQTLPHKHV